MDVLLTSLSVTFYVEVPMIREVGINLKLPLRLLSAHALRVPRELLSRGIIGLTLLIISSISSLFSNLHEVLDLL